MTNPLRTVAIKKFLTANTHADLAALYNHDMEVQINVAQDGGTRVEGEYEGKRWLAWTDNIQIWKPIRIPRNANTDPIYDDKPMSYNLDEHAEGIGLTGWDWKNKLSRWVAYDFDAITGHSEKHHKKLSDNQLLEIKQTLCTLPYTTVRLSTSGKGIHLYVFITPTPTANHNEHSALARAILHNLSGITGVDFNSKVDICGGNMWVWHRKMRGTAGLKIEKSGEILTDIPPNWRDHIQVVTGKVKRNLPQFVQELNIDETDKTFNELTGQRSKIPLDSQHRLLLDWLSTNGSLWWWDNDHHMMVTHTIYLKEAHKALNLKGQFETLAQGTERGADHNCYCYPISYGAWSVRRYSPGTAEANTWDQDGKGWTRCYLNRDIDLTIAARTMNGIEHPNGGWHFKDAQSAKAAIAKLGAIIELPDWIKNRPTKIKKHPKEDNKIIIEIPEGEHDRPDEMQGWLKEKGMWKRVWTINAVRTGESDISIASDDIIRHLINVEGADHGWVIKAEGKWNLEPLQHVQAALSTLGHNPKDVKGMIGANVFQPWRLINVPFQTEYPGDRCWNRDAAQLRFAPNPDRDNLRYPTWAKVLNHIGSSLDNAIRNHPWCIANGIIKGSEYLKCWISSMFKEPTEPLPYLFLYGDQDCGKSILHEALERIFTRGYMRVDHALANQSGFNGEMENAVLCVIEEIDLKRNLVAYNRIKDWVTSKTISIHKKQRTPYMAINCTHFIQCANDRAACPVFPGDTRITMIKVDNLTAQEKIPKKQMMHLLEKEASDFIAEIMNLELPVTNDRLNIPVLMTEDKASAEEANETMLEAFIRENCYNILGQAILVSEFWERFKEWLDPNEVHQWSKIKIGRMMPSKYPKGRLSNNPNVHFGNIAFDSTLPVLPEYKLHEGFLKS